MNLLKFFYLSLFSVLFSLGNTTNNQSENFQPFPTHWYEVSIIEGEEVIFIPCDYQNTEFIFENGNGIDKLVEVTGQDGWESIVEKVVPVDHKTTTVHIIRPDDVKIMFHVTQINKYLFNWKWQEPDYEGNSIEYSINMTPEEYKDHYKVVEEPPCM